MVAIGIYDAVKV